MKTNEDVSFEWFVGAAAVVAGVLLVLWGGAAASTALSGHPVEFGLHATALAATQLPQHLSDPANAWPDAVRSSIPGPWFYWPCNALAFAAMTAIAIAGWRWRSGRWRFGLEPRQRLGADTQARLASPVDLAPIVVPRAVGGRFVLGRVNGKLVATENRTTEPVGGPLQRRRAKVRQGDRGAVALMGPSRCGKTTAAIAGILEWEGPAVLSSVKNDLMADTIKWRSQLGEVKVFAPTHKGSATWSPLRAAATPSGARAAARALCDGAPRSGIDGGGDFWFTQVEILLASLLWVAANSKGTGMPDVCEWVMTQDRPTEDADGEVAPRLQQLLASSDRLIADGARRATNALAGIWQNDERLRGSVYTTAMTAVWPWIDPLVEASASGSEITLEWLLSGKNTLYLCGPLQDQRRYAPVFGGLIGDLVDRVYEHVDRTGKPLDPTLLLVLDEAANTPLRQLPEWASTVAGHGVQMVTIWQSKSQLDSIFGDKNADTILTNHLSKVGFAGLSDRSSLDYFSYLLGDEQVASRVLSSDGRGGSRPSLSESTSASPLAGAHVLRQVKPGEAVLVHGTLPPAHLHSRNFRKERSLLRRSDGSATVPATD